MTRIDTLLEAAVESLRRLPALVGLVSEITAFTNDNSEFRSLEEAVNAMSVPSILVAHIDSEMSTDGSSDFPRWAHKLAVLFRFERTTEAWAALDAIVNGTPDMDEGEKWMARDLGPGIWAPSDLVIDRITNADDIEMYRLAFRAVEQGG